MLTNTMEERRRNINNNIINAVSGVINLVNNSINTQRKGKEKK